MAYLLPSSDEHRIDAIVAPVELSTSDTLTDLKIFWGPDICRLEYLLHLLDTGRIKDEDEPASTPPCSG